jgi:RimJ/RimL family protein N-acetyltransferase
MIGQAGLTWQTIGDAKVLEVGYLFNRAYWGNGYATEAAVACKRYAFSVLHANEVYSIIRETNIASMNVAIRNGMLVRSRFVKHYRGVDMPHVVFCAKRG